METTCQALTWYLRRQNPESKRDIAKVVKQLVAKTGLERDFGLQSPARATLPASSSPLCILWLCLFSVLSSTSGPLHGPITPAFTPKSFMILSQQPLCASTSSPHWIMFGDCQKSTRSWKRNSLPCSKGYKRSGVSSGRSVQEREYQGCKRLNYLCPLENRG